MNDLNDITLSALLRGTHEDTKNEAADRIRARIAEHDGKLTRDKKHHVAGLREALALVVAD